MDQALARLIAVLLVGAAALFAVGSHIERGKEGTAESTRTQDSHIQAERPASRPSESSESAAQRTSESASRSTTSHSQQPPPPSRETIGESHRASRETIGESHREATLFGISPEAIGLVIAAVVGSVVLALAVWVRPTRLVLVAVAILGLVFAAFDVREVLHQVDVAHTDLVVIASALIGLHLLVAALAATALLRGRPLERLAAT